MRKNWQIWNFVIMRFYRNLIKMEGDNGISHTFQELHCHFLFKQIGFFWTAFESLVFRKMIDFMEVIFRVIPRRPLRQNIFVWVTWGLNFSIVRSKWLIWGRLGLSCLCVMLVVWSSLVGVWYWLLVRKIIILFCDYCIPYDSILILLISDVVVVSWTFFDSLRVEGCCFLLGFGPFYAFVVSSCLSRYTIGIM